jgi:hypothetical protein
LSSSHLVYCLHENGRIIVAAPGASGNPPEDPADKRDWRPRRRASPVYRTDAKAVEHTAR